MKQTELVLSHLDLYSSRYDQISGYRLCCPDSNDLLPTELNISLKETVLVFDLFNPFLALPLNFPTPQVYLNRISVALDMINLVHEGHAVLTATMSYLLS